MGQILKTKIMPSGKIVLHLELTTEEAKNLKNHAKKIWTLMVFQLWYNKWFQANLLQ